MNLPSVSCVEQVSGHEIHCLKSMRVFQSWFILESLES